MVTLYVEGGGDSSNLKSECRQAFSTFLKRAGISKLPRISACGGRQQVFDKYKTAIAENKSALLLVDSEAPVADQHQSGEPQNWQPWQHLKTRDNWERPSKASDSDCHLMVQCMESWLVADPENLKTYFGQGFKDKPLPPSANVEAIDKKTLYDSLKKATSDCKKKGVYDKGRDSFALLKDLAPEKVLTASSWAQRFIVALQTQLNPTS